MAASNRCQAKGHVGEKQEYCLSVLCYKYNFVNKALWVLLNLTLWPSLLGSPA